MYVKYKHLILKFKIVFMNKKKFQVNRLIKPLHVQIRCIVAILKTQPRY